MNKSSIVCSRNWKPSAEACKRIIETTVLRNPWIPHVPTGKQALFLSCLESEAFYGGAAGGGKSDALLMAALQWVDHPRYAAILFRRTYADLALPGALMDRAFSWLYGSRARWDATRKTWIFPSGATLSFGYLDHENDKYRYQGSEYQFIGIDELTQFSESQYLYLFSRLRRVADVPIPLRMRAGSNPGGLGHEWVKKRFISSGERVYVPARLADNPHLDRESYEASLSQLDPITRAQLLAGDWDAYQGGRFLRQWFDRTYRREGDYFLFSDRPGERIHREEMWVFSTVDPAATPQQTSDYTVIGTFAVPPWGKACCVLDIVRERLPLDRIVPRIAEVASIWRPVYVGIETVAFQEFLIVEASRRRDMPAVKRLSPHAGKLTPTIKQKLARATPAIIWASQHQIYLPEGAAWLDDFLLELMQFTGDDNQDAYDDQVDALAYAIIELDKGGFIKGEEIMTDEQPARQPLTPRATGTAQQRRGLYGLSGQ